MVDKVEECVGKLLKIKQSENEDWVKYMILSIKSISKNDSPDCH